MATIIDTSPAANFAMDDANNSDTIAVVDGPIESGFQTTEVTTATDTFIFANKTAVTIDGGNKGDSVVFDNPDPAAGMQSLTVQNLGTGSTINGSNPSVNSPDISVATLSLQASTGIGVSRALRTQVSTLNALTSTGGVFITNGVNAPVTLNIGNGGGGVRVTSLSRGDIVLTNNGTIDSLSNNDIISAPGNVTVKALGANADFNIGGQSGFIPVQARFAGGWLVDLEADPTITLAKRPRLRHVADV